MTSARRSGAAKRAAKFSVTLAKADFSHIPDDSGTLIVASSGGPDSAAALLLLRAARPDARLIACYVDHGVRPKARIARDIAAVRVQARAANARVVICSRNLLPRANKFARLHSSSEAALREYRYAQLARVAKSQGVKFIVTGHQRDDVAESMLLALARGSGLDGLAAMRPLRRLNESLVLVRPLLNASKSELEAIARSFAAPVSRDETNADLRHRRNAVRVLLRALERAAPGAMQAIARSADLLAADKSLLDRVTERAYRRCLTKADGVELSAAALRKLPAFLLRRVIRYAVARSAGTARDFHFAHCEAIARAIVERRGGTFHAGRASVVLSSGKLRVRTKNVAARIYSRAILAQPGTTKIDTPWGILRLRYSSDGRSKDRPLRLIIRMAQPGDKCIPSGRKHGVSLARFLAKAGVAKDQRNKVPLLCEGDRIVAALGVRVMEPYASKSARALEIDWRAK